MSASQNKTKGGAGGTVGVAILFLALAGIGVGAALLLTKKGGGKEEKDAPPPPPPVVAATKLVEAPPPLPEVAPVVEETPEEPAPVPAVEEAGNPGTKKKALPLGTIDTKAAQEVTKRNYAKVRACYEKQLKLNSILQGGITVKITVFPDGSVNSLKFVDDTVHNSTMNECIRKEILSWQFPKPEGGKVEIHQSYKFEPKAG